MKAIILTLLLLASRQTLWSQNEDPDYFLWKVNIHGSEFALVGSVHAGKPEYFPLPDAYMKAYHQADKVIMELKECPKALREMVFSYAKKDSLAGGQSLDKHLSAESKEILSVIFMGKEELLYRYFRYEGWLLNSVVSVWRSVLIGYNPECSVDRYFHDLATRDKKEIIGLDSVETQLALFDFDVPFETQLKILESGIRSAGQRARAEEPLYENYYSNNEEGFKEAFLKLMNLENPQMRSVYDQVFVSRNKAWVRELIDLSSSHPGTYFMVVGSGHYFGPDNVLELLESKGFTVEHY
jgi:uncharacterized protein